MTEPRGELRCVLAIVPEARLGRVEAHLRHRERRFTRILAQGGFMRRGSAVLVLVTPPEHIEGILEDLRAGGSLELSQETESGTVVFVLPMEAALQL